MSAGASDSQLKELLEYTKALLSAAELGNSDEIGRQLESRQLSIETIKSAGGVIGTRSEERQALVNQILSLDKKACLIISKLAKEYGQTASDYQKKAAGLLKYSNDMYNLASGQLVDKRD